MNAGPSCHHKMIRPRVSIEERLMFDTKIAIVVRSDLQSWQKLNVTAFLMSGIVAAHPTSLAKRTGTPPAMFTIGSAFSR